MPKKCIARVNARTARWRGGDQWPPPPLARLGYLRAALVKMSVSPMPVRSMALLRPSVHTG